LSTHGYKPGTLGRSWLGGLNSLHFLSGGSLGGGGLSSGLDSGSLLNRYDRLDNGRSGFSSWLSDGGSLLGSGDSLLFLLCLLLLAEGETTEDAVSLLARRSCLGLFLLLLSGLNLLSGGSLGGNSLSGSRGLSSSGNNWGGGSLLLGDGGRLEALQSLLEALRLGDTGGELLGLGNLELQLRNPVVTLSDIGRLEGVLVALGVNDELGGAVNSGLGSLGLYKTLDSIVREVASHEYVREGWRQWEPWRPCRRTTDPCQSHPPKQ
jgi:hypothetical protein